MYCVLDNILIKMFVQRDLMKWWKIPKGQAREKYFIYAIPCSNIAYSVAT